MNAGLCELWKNLIKHKTRQGKNLANEIVYKLIAKKLNRPKIEKGKLKENLRKGATHNLLAKFCGRERESSLGVSRWIRRKE